MEAEPKGFAEGSGVGMRERDGVARMTPRFLARAVEWIQCVFAEMGRQWESRPGAGNQELRLGHVLLKCPQPSEWRGEVSGWASRSGSQRAG